MQKLNKTQVWFIIFTLVIGACYMLFGGKNSTFLSPTSGIDLSKVKSETSLKISNWKTNNNIPVYFVSAQELPMVDIALTFRAGAAYAPQKPGLAVLTNDMLFEGTKNYNTEQISEIFESLGAEYSAGAGTESANLNLRSLTDKNKLNKSLAVFTDVLANASFPQKSFVRVKNNTLTGLKLQEQYPENILDKKFYKELYKNHPYAIPSDGEIADVEKLNVNDLVNFFKKFYVAENAMISMVGNLSLDEAKAIADKIANSIRSGVRAEDIPTVSDTMVNINKHVDYPSSQTHIMVGSIGIKRSDPDYYALMLGNHVLGSMPLSSLLFKNVRVDKGLAYSVYSTFVPMQDKGPFLINMQTRNEKAKEALSTTLETLSGFITNGPTEEQLILAKQNLTGKFPLTISSNSKKLSAITKIGFYDLPLDYLDTYVDKINQVSAEDIVRAFNKRIELNQLAIVTVGGSSDSDNKETIGLDHEVSVQKQEVNS